MRITSKQRNIIAGMIVAILIIGAGVFLATRGSSSTAGPATSVASTTPTAAPVKTTQTETTASPAAATPVVDETSASAQPEATATPAAVTSVEIVSESESPASVKLGDPVTFTIKVKGDAVNVSVVYGAAGGDVSTPHLTTNLLPTDTSGGVTTWTGTVPAPKGFGPGGTCFYHAIAINENGQEIKSPGQVDAYQTFVVTP